MSTACAKDRSPKGMEQKPLEELCCVNPDCKDAGRKGAGNLVVRLGKGRSRWRVLRCRTCKQEFSERKGTALWGTRMEPEKALAIAEHLKEGCGIRKTARLVGASTDGVTSIAIRCGLHASAVHDKKVRNLKVTEVQFDEKWSYVGKKEKKCDPDNPADSLKGDQWDHTAVDVKSRVVTSVVIGKRSQENLEQIVADLSERSSASPPLTDHNG